VRRWYVRDFPEVKERLIKLVQAHPDNRFIYAVLIDYAVAEGDKEKARQYLMTLKVIDRLRENYY
jgi:hypothetical protein